MSKIFPSLITAVIILLPLFFPEVAIFYAALFILACAGRAFRVL